MDVQVNRSEAEAASLRAHAHVPAGGLDFRGVQQSIRDMVNGLLDSDLAQPVKLYRPQAVEANQSAEASPFFNPLEADSRKITYGDAEDARAIMVSLEQLYPANGGAGGNGPSEAHDYESPRRVFLDTTIEPNTLLAFERWKTPTETETVTLICVDSVMLGESPHAAIAYYLIPHHG